MSRPVLGFTQSPIKWVPGSFPGVKRPGPEVNHTPSSAEVKNELSYTSVPPVCIDSLDDETFAFLKIITIKST
jgi:hypothetical protein